MPLKTPRKCTKSCLLYEQANGNKALFESESERLSSESESERLIVMPCEHTPFHQETY